MAQIRLNKTPEMNEVLTFLKSKYHLLSEAEIIKLALAEKYHKEIKDENIEYVDEETEKAIGRALEDYKNGRYTELRSNEEMEKYLDSL